MESDPTQTTQFNNKAVARERARCLAILDDEGWLGKSRQRIESGLPASGHAYDRRCLCDDCVTFFTEIF